MNAINAINIVKWFTKFLIILILCGLWFYCSGLVSAQSVDNEGGITIAWDANKETDLAGYKVYVGVESGIYNEPITLDTKTQYTVRKLITGTMYYLALTAFDNYGNESGYSTEVSGKAKDIIFPATPTGLKEVTAVVGN